MLEPLLDSIADGVFSVDLDWRITYFNRAAEQITGVPREEALGQICCEIFKADICERECALRQTLKTGEPIIDKQIYIINTDGDQVPVSISTAILKNESGEIIGGVETFRDLSRIETLRRELNRSFTYGDIVTRNTEMRKLCDLISEIAESDITVLITGESGTGKELFARAIHNVSSRKAEPFIAVNCGALPETLLESELFGYKKGAFTGATRDKPGRFALAGKGSLFLDEIGELPPGIQVKLLRVLEERVYEPLGSVKTERTDARIITATNRNLETLAAEGKFREDLLFRINVITLHIPPLRDRVEDIPVLCDHFIEKFNLLQNKHIQGISREALAILLNYTFPGNVRELRNFIQRAFVLTHSGYIQPEHLPPQVLRSADSRENAFPVPDSDKTVSNMEKQLIMQALRAHRGNRRKAAEQLGMHRATLYRKMKRYGIDG